MTRPTDNSQELHALLDQHLGWNTLHDAMTRGAQITAWRIHEAYNDHDCHKIAQAVLAEAMKKPLDVLFNAAIDFDDEIRKLLGMQPGKLP